MTSKIIKWLSARPSSFTIKVHGGWYQRAGVPDIYHIENEVSYWFEVKLPGGAYGATPLQQATLKKLTAAGAIAAVVCSVEEVQEIVEPWQ